MQYLDQHLPKRITFAVIGLLLFVLLGQAIPDFYFKYFDKTQYYSIIQPIPMDQKWYKPCDETTLTATRTSLIDTQASFSIDLILTKSDGTEILKVPNGHLNRDASVKAGEKQTISVIYPLPCELPDGIYFWQATMKYSVRGVEKQYTYITDTFNVNEFGASPDAIKAATSSAQLNRPPLRFAPQNTPTPKPTPVQNDQKEPVIIINNQQSQDNPTPEPQPTAQPAPQPTPTPSGGTQICLPIVGCVL